MLKEVGNVVSIFLIIFGFLAFLSGSYFYSKDNEIPLGNINGFIVDNDDKIYVGLGFYERVQVYNKNGEFIENWPIHNHGGMFYMNKTKEDQILITSARGNEQILYDKKGNILSRKIIDDEIFSNFYNNWRKFKSENGEMYEIKGLIFQKLIRINPEKIIIQQNILLQLIKGPFNVWLLAVLGGLIRYLIFIRKP